MQNFRSSQFLKNHIASILDFYQPEVVDNQLGGFQQNYYDNGDTFDTGLKHLVSSTRIIINYCKAYQHGRNEQDLEKAKHGLRYLKEVHWDGKRQGYNWLLEDNKPIDQTNHCYGLAFVILALATCYETGIADTKDDLYATWQLLNDRFWQAEQQLYADEASPDWSQTSDYRGQNANMHCCEALLVAYQATNDQQFLGRACTLAKTVAITLADKADGLIWEHYTADLAIDWQYNHDDPKNLYRPWGFQPGHQTEWAKLLLILHRYQPEDWMINRAKALFDRALAICWDDKQGGIFYGHAPDGEICDHDKYFWVQAETFAAAALLADVTGEEKYWQWYDNIWQFCWQNMVDHEYGAWYRVLTGDNQKYNNEKSIAGGKCDYHTLGACWEVLALIERKQ